MFVNAYWLWGMWHSQSSSFRCFFRKLKNKIVRIHIEACCKHSLFFPPMSVIEKNHKCRLFHVSFTDWGFLRISFEISFDFKLLLMQPVCYHMEKQYILHKCNLLYSHTVVIPYIPKTQKFQNNMRINKCYTCQKLVQRMNMS